MQSRTRLNIALVAGLAVIAVLFWLAAREEAGDRPMLDLESAAVERIQALEGERLHWSLVRDGDDWRIEEPLQAPAHPDRVTMMLQLLRAPVRARYAVEDVELARFGLDEPALTVRVNEHVLILGDGEPVQRRRYVRLGDEVLLVDDIVFHQFNRRAEVLVDNRLLPGGGPVEMIEFGALRLSLDDAGRWGLKPVTEGLAHLESDDLARMSRNWMDAQAPETLGWPVPDLDAPMIRVRQADGSIRLFYLLESNDGQVTLGSPDTGLRYRFPATQRPALMPDPEYWAENDDA